MVRETLLKLLEISGALDEYVILKEDEKGRYIEYAFKEGEIKDNRCLSWYDKPHPIARVRNGWEPDHPVHEVGKIYKLGLFSCGLQNETGDNHCSAGHPLARCVTSGCAKHWTYEEPVKCACWFLKETEVKKVEDIPLLKGYTLGELEEKLIKSLG